MSRAMEIVPQYSEGPDGSEQIINFNVNRGHSAGVVNEEFYIDEYEQGHFVEPDIQDPTDYPEEESDISYDYSEACVEAMPDLPQAISWAANNLPSEFLEYYNESIDSEDPDLMWPAMEQLLEMFYDTTGAEPTEIEEQDEELSEPQKVIDSLMEAEPAGYEESEDWQDACDAYQQSGQEVHAAIAAASAAFHAGETSADEAINYILQNYDNEDVILAYQSMYQ